MNIELRRRVRSVVGPAALLLANLTVLMVVSISMSVHADLDVRSNSGSPVTDGAINAILVVMALTYLNGVLLCLSPRTRRYGIGALVAAVAAIPVGLVVSFFALGALLNDT